MDERIIQLSNWVPTSKDVHKVKNHVDIGTLNTDHWKGFTHFKLHWNRKIFSFDIDINSKLKSVSAKGMQKKF